MAFAIQMDADGSFSLGFSTTVLPAAIAIGKNHIGTIAGKLNGLMMPTTPSGCRSEYTSTPGRDLLAVLALGEVRDAAGELDDLEAAGDLATRVGEHLAVLGGEDRGQFVFASVQDLAEREQHRGALRPGGVRPVGERGLGDRTAWSTSPVRGEADLALHDALRGVVHGGGALRCARESRAADPVVEDLCSHEAMVRAGHFRNILAAAPAPSRAYVLTNAILAP